MTGSQRGRFGPHLMLKALGGAIAVGLAYAIARTATVEPVAAAAARMDVGDLGTRVLVIAPHPDDEAIAPGGLISEALAAGSRVRVVVITAGDGYRRAAARIANGPITAQTFLRLGRMRHAESHAALGELGVPEKDRVFLAYPDGSLNSLWERNWDLDQLHRGADGCTSSPYDFADFPRTPFCGSSLVSDLEKIVTDYDPTAIIYPDANDTHHDHWAAAAFVDYTLQDLAYEGRRYTYLTHFGHYPFPWLYLPGTYVQPPASLLRVGTRWHSLSLTQRAEQLKLRALEMYRTQFHVPDLKIYLLAFVRRNELFGTHEPMRPLAISLDPGPTVPEIAADRVVIEPRLAGISAVVRKRGVVSAVRLVQGPRELWMGVSTAEGAPADLSYEFHLRLFGGGAPARFDATVTDEMVQIFRHAQNSIVPASVTVSRSGDTLWIGLPATVLDGRESAMVAGGTRLRMGSGSAYRSAWRPVLLPAQAPVEEVALSRSVR